jgi:hypothetical protein
MDSAGGEVKFAGAKLRALRVREIDAAKLEASELPSRDAAMRNWPAQRAELQLDPWERAELQLDPWERAGATGAWSQSFGLYVTR